MQDSSLYVTFVFGILSIFFVPLIIRYGLFSLPVRGESSSQKIPFFSPLFAACIVPIVGAFIVKCEVSWLPFSTMQNFAIAQCSALLVSATVLVGLVRMHSPDIQKKIFGTKPLFKAILKGIFSCFMIYPLIMLGMQFIHVVVDWYQPGARNEQDAIRLFRKLRETPWLFWTFGFIACTLIPFVEELLFRGFFQNWLTDRIGRGLGIAVGALLFAAAHFSLVQGITNIELMIGLFTMGCFLGIVYLREQSLAASIAMHGTFNGLTLLLFTVG